MLRRFSVLFLVLPLLLTGCMTFHQPGRSLEFETLIVIASADFISFVQ